MRPVISHIDLRVKNRAVAEKFYGRIFALVGGEMHRGTNFTTFGCPVEGGLLNGNHSFNWVGFTEDTAMVPGSTRVALFASDRAMVANVAAILPEIGATRIEWDENEYGEDYFAVFFCDPDGNALEVCCYESDHG